MLILKSQKNLYIICVLLCDMKLIQVALSNDEYQSFLIFKETLFKNGLINRNTNYAALKFLIKNAIKQLESVKNG